MSGRERLKGGVTTSVNLFGGGADVYRVDDPKYADAYLGAIRDIGVRWFLGVGPRRGPFPSAFTDWTSGKPHAIKVDFAQQLGVSEALICKWDKAGDGRIRMAGGPLGGSAFPLHGGIVIGGNRADARLLAAALALAASAPLVSSVWLGLEFGHAD